MTSPPFRPGRRAKLPPPEVVISYFNEKIEQQKRQQALIDIKNKPLPPPPPQDVPIDENVPTVVVSKVRDPIYVNAENLLYENVYTVIPETDPLREQDPKQEEELPKQDEEIPKQEKEVPKEEKELPKQEKELQEPQSKKWTRYRTVRAKKGTSINYMTRKPTSSNSQQTRHKSPPPYIVERPDTSNSKEPLEGPNSTMEVPLAAVEEFLRSVPLLVPRSATSKYISQLIKKRYKKETPKGSLEFAQGVIPAEYREPELLLNDDIYPFNLPDGWASSCTVKKRDVYIDHNSKSNYFLHPAHQITQAYEFPKQLTESFDCPKMSHPCFVIGERQIFYNLVKQYNKMQPRKDLGAAIAKKIEFRYERIPFWIQIYSIANEKYDDKINWDIFGLDELKDYLLMLQLQFEEDKKRIKSDHEYNHSVIAQEIQDRFFGKLNFM